jgi:NADH:ubiquinone oxidoreductase subunit F (NADH-binding)
MQQLFIVASTYFGHLAPKSAMPSSTRVVKPARSAPVTLARIEDHGVVGAGGGGFPTAVKLAARVATVVVNGAECATAFKVRDFGVPADAGKALVEARDQKVMDGRLTVDRAVAPTAAWVVVHLDQGGMPGRRVGLAHIPAGETRGLVVQLDASVPLTDKVLVAVHADRGEAGMFEFAMDDKVNSPDQPFFVDGAEVAIPVAVK